MAFVAGTMAVIGATVGAVSSVSSGFAANAAAKQEAGLQQQQADLALKNSQDNAEVEAANATQFVQRQKVAYLANGVTLEGSPSMVVKNTRDQSQKNVQAILDRGTAEYNLGMGQKAQTLSKGRAALIGGILGGVTDVASGVTSAYKSGMFDAKTPGNLTITGPGSFSNTAPSKMPVF